MPNGSSDFVSVDSCSFLSNQYGLYFENKGGTRFHYCNFVGNQNYGAYNYDLDTSVDARYSWWGHATGPYHPVTNPYGQGDRVSDSIRYDGYLSQEVQIVPLLDVAADELVWPKGTIISDTAYEVVPSGWVKSNYDDTLVNVGVVMRIGAAYEETLAPPLMPYEQKYYEFPACTLDPGTYQVTFFTMLAGDENPGNDTIIDTLIIRAKVDVAAIEVLAPVGTITIEDTIEPRVSVANYTDTTRYVPVEFYLDSALIETVSDSVAPHETTEVVFTERGFPGGDHEVMFATCLEIDDDRSNDTVSTSIQVLIGDFWVAEDSPPVSQARMCWLDDLVYAADRSVPSVCEFDVSDDEWGSMAAPPLDTVYGITTLEGQVYVLGKPAGGSFGKGGVTVLGGSSDAAMEEKARVLPGGPSSSFSSGPEVYRYDAGADSWVFVTTCDSTLSLGNSSNIVGDGKGSIYLIEGGSTTVLRYIVALDSWAPVPAAPELIDRWGAAGWCQDRLYVLANADMLLEYDAQAQEWGYVPPPGMMVEEPYGTGLCCDPVLDRVFVFCQAGMVGGIGGGVMTPGAGAFWERRNETGTWIPRASLTAETTGTALCFASTQAYCLDGDGGFWRYRPLPIHDAGAVAVLVPDTVARDSTFTPRGIVQNSWQDSRLFSAVLRIGGSYYDSVGVALPAQSWDTVSFAPAMFESDSPEPFAVSLTVALAEDSVPENDTVFDTLFVRYRKDAAAVTVLFPSDRIPYDSLIQPAGVIENRSDESLEVWVRMTIEPWYADSHLVELAPFEQVEDSTFDTCHLPLGEHEVELRVLADGDEVPGNDTALGSVEVVNGDYWRLRACSPIAVLRLTDGLDENLCALDRTSERFSEYSVPEDTWLLLAESPLSQHKSAWRCEDKVYALGLMGEGFDSDQGLTPSPEDQARAGMMPAAIGAGLPKTWETSAGIVCYDISAEEWSTVTAELPVDPADGLGLFAEDERALYVLAEGPATNLYKYFIAEDSWCPMEPLPATISSWTASTYDREDHIYVLTGLQGNLYSYQLSKDTWTALTPLGQMPTSGTALSCDPGRNRLYALWTGNLIATNFWAYDIAEHQWAELEHYPYGFMNPALAVSGRQVFGQGGDGTGEFAEYMPVPDVDVAAVGILSPPDTVRFDSMVQPVGVVQNLSPVPVWCFATFIAGEQVGSQEQVYLEPEQTDTVWFDSTFLAPGHQTVWLQVSCAGDVNPENDFCSKEVQVEAPWEPRAAPEFSAGRLDADTGTVVYAADRSTATVSGYDIAADTWLGLVPSPFETGNMDLCYYDNQLYVLGMPVQDEDTDGSNAGVAGTDGPSFAAIYRLELGDTAWYLVTDSVPVDTGTGNPWIAATETGIYLKPSLGAEFYHYDSINGWVERASVPVPATTPCALDWDRDEAIYLLTKTEDSSCFFSYATSADTWAGLPQMPGAVGPGVCLAAEPLADYVYAFAPGLGLNEFYQYDRSSQTWTQKTSPSWCVANGAALVFAGSQVYALTGQPTTPSWFWCFDPLFVPADRQGKGTEGVAGRTGVLSYCLYQSRPNPFSDRTEIRWQVPSESRVELEIFDIAGRQVRTLCQGRFGPGRYSSAWDGLAENGRPVPAGVYLCRLQAGTYHCTRKVVLSRGR